MSLLPGGLVPSPMRTYKVPNSICAGSGFGMSNIVVVAPKSSADTLDYSFDLTDVLAATGDLPVSVDDLILPQNCVAFPLQVEWSGIQNYTVTVALTSGPPNMELGIGIPVNTYQGRRIIIPVMIIINDVTVGYTPPVKSLPADVTTSGGVLLAGATPLPAGFSSLGGLVIADVGTVLPAGYTQNGQVVVPVS